MHNPKERQRLMSLLGIAQKAGKIASGEQACELAIREGKACTVLLSQDASATTEKKFSNRCFCYQVPLYRTDSTKEEIGRAIGKGYRSVLAICEPGLASSIEALTDRIS